MNCLKRAFLKSCLKYWRKRKNMEVAETSTIEVPVGTTSLLGDAVVGREGHLFLVGGINEVNKLYEDGPHPAKKWGKLIGARLEKLKQRGIVYAQLFIPEKQSVMPDLFLGKVSGPSRLLVDVNSYGRALQDTHFKYLDVVEVLRHREDVGSCYFKTDTHFTYNGNIIVFRSLAARLGSLIHNSRQRLVSFIRIGDLSTRFLRGLVVERAYGPTGCQNDWSDIFLDHCYEPDGENNTGCIYVWKNKGLLHGKKVICFGNSFFGRGRDPFMLSWWFARQYGEFHFIWSAEFDYDYIDKVKPDIVIGQSIERFMRRVPKE